MLIATNDSSSVTINIEDLKSIINQEVEKQVQQKMEIGVTGISQKSVLMSSINLSKEMGTFKLNSFTNTFGEDFSKYFEYDSTNGVLTCKEEGWFITTLQIQAYQSSGTWFRNTVNCYVNDVCINKVVVTVGNVDRDADNNSSTPIYLKKGDKLSFSREINNSKANSCNNYINLIKM